MSTLHRHTLKKANQAQRKRSSQPPERRPGPPVRPTLRSLKRLGKNRWFWIGLVLLVVLIGSGLWYYNAPHNVFSSRGTSPSSASSTASSQVQQAPTAASTVTQNWQTVRTLSGASTGNGTKKTDTFTVSKNWQITWNCQGVNGVDDWLYIAIYNPDGTLYNAGAQVTCIAAKMVTGSVQEAKSGTFYLTVDANTDWTITIQQAK